MPEPVTAVLDRPTPAPLELTLHPAADPVAPVLLVVPAMGMRASFYTPLLGALADAGVAAAVTELRGHQARPAPPPGRRHDHGYDDLVGDLGAAVETVRELRPGAPVLPLGHSLGGHLCAAFAARRPDRVDGLALVASGSVDWRVWGPGHLLRTQAVVAAASLLGHFPGDRVGFAGREARGQMRDWGRWARTGRLAFGTPRVDHGPSIAALPLPVLGIGFERDTLAPPASTAALLDMFAAAEVTRHLLDVPARRPHVGWAREPGALAVVVPVLAGWARGAGRP
ncbi:alpha/beta fold hydrolase [Pseudonocardia spirodelae]|uniref:Alpha/beta fold hydrolase n=1 Tax=Pseudonocardia spirodelae TaxID=3133431 RepID=A0ABU8TCI5_9PSEU